MSTKIHQMACATWVGTMEYTPRTATRTHHRQSSRCTGSSPLHVSIGYDDHARNDRIWTVPGQMSGLVWMEITLSQSNRPTRFVPPDLPYLGPRVALVALYHLVPPNDALSDHHSSVMDAGRLVQSTIQNDPHYDGKFRKALQIWQRHVQECWSNVVRQHHGSNSNNNNRSSSNVTMKQMMNDEGMNLTTTPLKYRISCLRNDSKKYVYSRRELLRHIDGILPSSPLFDTYTVDLTHYDLEIVICYRPYSFWIGLAVQPHQYVGSGKSFASGALPPDLLAGPVQSSPSLSLSNPRPDDNNNNTNNNSHLARVVRLRPSTAQILLHLARLQPGDILLDPCVGMGTIPIETTMMIQQQQQRVFAIGGDLALNNPTFHQVTVDYLRRTRSTTGTNKETYLTPDHAVPDLLAWDATHLPIRTAAIDVVVTDLPFGQFCMSAVKLDAFLPLLMAEMARVVRPSGRMVLLCGSYIGILRSLIYANECLASNSQELIWELPCTAVFPVNIGGNLAWVVQVRRSCGRPKSLPDQRDKIRKLIQKREHTEKIMRGSTNTVPLRTVKMKPPQS